jgi:hypothetical protein
MAPSLNDAIMSDAAPSGLTWINLLLRPIGQRGTRSVQDAARPAAMRAMRRRSRQVAARFVPLQGLKSARLKQNASLLSSGLG